MVSIITVNYNGWKDTCELIASLKQFETYPYEIIVVDNASSGDDVLQIHKEFPEVLVIESDKNLGFAGGNNLGYKHAHGNYLFFLNNDTVVKKPVLEPLVNKLKDAAVGGVSPMIRGFYPPYEVQYCGLFKMTPVTLRHPIAASDVIHSDNSLLGREVEVMHGAAMMLRREVIEEIGVMSEAYFLFYEEYDWSYRLLQRHYKVWYEPASLIYHKEGQSIGRITPLREYYLTRGRVLFARRNLEGLYKMLSCCYLLSIVMLRNIIKYMLSGDWRLLKATISGPISGILATKKG